MQLANILNKATPLPLGAGRGLRFAPGALYAATAVFSALLVALLCGAPSASALERLPVFVSIAPQKYFVERIGADRVTVSVMVAPGANPATYEPRPRQMVALGSARIYFAVGAPFESAWLSKIVAANPSMKVIHTDAGIEKIAMAAHTGDEGHGEAGHAPGGLDPHVWLSPPLVKTQAAHILDALVAADTAGAAVYRANYLAFARDLDSLNVDLKQVFQGKTGGEFMVFHPSWGYFARAYGLRQVPVEIEGKNPKPAQLQALITHARERGIQVVFVQPQFSKRSAEIIAKAIGGKVVVADPLAEDWLTNIRRQAEAIAAALR